MATRIRLQRHGRKKAPFYRIVVTEEEARRDGRYLERIGTLNPLVEGDIVELNEERVKYWLSVGAQPSDRVVRIIDRQIPGCVKQLEESRTEKIRSKRAARKARQKARA